MKLVTGSIPSAFFRTSPRRFSLLRFVGLFAFWCDRSAQRLHLAQLDDRMLRDIGVSRADAYGESQKWFWQD